MSKRFGEKFLGLFSRFDFLDMHMEDLKLFSQDRLTLFRSLEGDGVTAAFAKRFSARICSLC
jgi:hypothetical protein